MLGWVHSFSQLGAISFELSTLSYELGCTASVKTPCPQISQDLL